MFRPVRAVGCTALISAPVAVLARLCMRAIALDVGNVPTLTVSGSVFILVVFTVSALPVGVVAARTRVRRLRVTAAVLGSAFLAYTGAAIGVDEVSSATALTPSRWVVLALCCCAIAALVGAQPVLVVRAVDSDALLRNRVR